MTQNVAQNPVLIKGTKRPRDKEQCTYGMGWSVNFRTREVVINIFSFTQSYNQNFEGHLRQKCNFCQVKGHLNIKMHALNMLISLMRYELLHIYMYI